MSGADSWFDLLYRSNSERLFKIANKVLRNRSVAEELVQDVFVVLLLRRADVEQYDSPKAFLTDVMQKRIGNELQKAARKREEPLEAKHEAIAATESRQERLEDILPDWLMPQERKLLIWKIEDGLSYEEIAPRLGCSVRACHGKMYRLRQKFEKNYKKEL